MAWTTPTSRSVGLLITPTIWNTDLVDNLLYLKTPVVTIGTTYTVTDTTSTTFVPIVDAQSITTTSGARVLMIASGWAQHLETGTILAEPGVRIDDADPYAGPGARVWLSGTSEQYTWSFAYISNVLSPGTHTLRLYGRVAAGGGTQGAVRFTTRTFLLIEL